MGAPRIDNIFDIHALQSEIENAQKSTINSGYCWESKKICIQDVLNNKTDTQQDDVPVFG